MTNFLPILKFFTNQACQHQADYTKGPSIFFIIIPSVHRVIFSQPPLPLKVHKSSKKNYDGGRFHEIKHADPGSRGRTGDRTSFRAGSLGRHDHTTYSTCTKMRTSAECCNVWQVRDNTLWRATTHFCNSYFKNRSSFFKKRTLGLNPLPPKLRFVRS
jgi:hypothetical protein